MRGAMDGGKLVGPAAGGAGVFATYPAFDNLGRNFLSEFLATAVLLVGVRALTDRRNAAPGGYVEPLALGALVWAIGLSLGGLTGYAINPARDLGSTTRVGPSGLGNGRLRVARRLLLGADHRSTRRRLAGVFLYDFAIHRLLPAERRAEPAGGAFALIPQRRSDPTSSSGSSRIRFFADTCCLLRLSGVLAYC